MSTKRALVMRATGRQGKGAILHLVKAGWQIHALVSDASSDRALALKSFGPQVTLYQGTWNDPRTVQKAMKSCRALFFNQLPSPTANAEAEEARVILALANELGVEHVVFPSSLPLSNANIREDLRDSPAAALSVFGKADVEELVKASGLTWTLLRPGYFLTNLLPPVVYFIHPEIKENRIINSYGPDCMLTVADPDDIGAFAAAAFEYPTKFGSKIVTAVSEIIRFDDLVKELGSAIGKDIKAVYRTPEETEKLKDDRSVAGQLMCIGLDKLVDMEEVRGWGVQLTSSKQFLEKHKRELPGPAAPANEQ